ncbi:hypothetical protein Pcinc_018143 [Petrolisthes cinctipes]|uniref:Uncharacterized protein n=1 Tax=Petrolisthes cinctipes TaxID=88211 RepID=A0AAE1KP45_PETCI|nr:hypothetical protein Pcinc_018143 [Petrolisthes cinctipes]
MRHPWPSPRRHPSLCLFDQAPDNKQTLQGDSQPTGLTQEITVKAAAHLQHFALSASSPGVDARMSIAPQQTNTARIAKYNMQQSSSYPCPPFIPAFPISPSTPAFPISPCSSCTLPFPALPVSPSTPTFPTFSAFPISPCSSCTLPFPALPVSSLPLPFPLPPVPPAPFLSQLSLSPPRPLPFPLPPVPPAPFLSQLSLSPLYPCLSQLSLSPPRPLPFPLPPVPPAPVPAKPAFIYNTST